MALEPNHIMHYTDIGSCTASACSACFTIAYCPNTVPHGVHDWHALSGPSEEAPVVHCRGLRPLQGRW